MLLERIKDTLRCSIKWKSNQIKIPQRGALEDFLTLNVTLTTVKTVWRKKNQGHIIYILIEGKMTKSEEKVLW